MITRDKYFIGDENDFVFIKSKKSLANVILAKAGFDPNQERDSDGKWTDGPAGGSWHNIDTKKVMELHKEYGGSTHTIDGKNQIGAKGKASVSTFPERSEMLEEPLTQEILDIYIELNEDILNDSDNFAVGTWLNTKTGQTWLDIVTIADLDDAIDLGLEYNQIAIFDLENLIEIPTGGTGEKKQLWAN